MSNPTTVLGAYEYTLAIVQDLEASGVHVERKESRSRTSTKVLAKYGNLPGRLPPEKWLHIRFTIKSKEDQQAIFDARQGLIWLGIYFDSGGSPGQRDWELDWSFYLSEEIDSDHERQIGIIEAGLSKVKAEATNSKDMRSRLIGDSDALQG